MKAEFIEKQKKIKLAKSKSPTKKKKENESSDDESKDLSDEDEADLANVEVPWDEEEFQRWMKQMENIGNGLSQRVAEKLGTPGGVAARFK